MARADSGELRRGPGSLPVRRPERETSIEKRRCAGSARAGCRAQAAAACAALEAAGRPALRAAAVRTKALFTALSVQPVTSCFCRCRWRFPYILSSVDMLGDKMLRPSRSPRIVCSPAGPASDTGPGAATPRPAPRRA